MARPSEYFLIRSALRVFQEAIDKQVLTNANVAAADTVNGLMLIFNPTSNPNATFREADKLLLRDCQNAIYEMSILPVAGAATAILTDATILSLTTTAGLVALLTAQIGLPLDSTNYDYATKNDGGQLDITNPPIPRLAAHGVL